MFSNDMRREVITVPEDDKEKDKDKDKDKDTDKDKGKASSKPTWPDKAMVSELKIFPPRHDR